MEGKVTLNVSPRAVRELLIDEAGLSFQGRFGGSPFAVYVPLNAVVAIYARETGAGTVLGPEPAEGEENPLSVAESPESPEDDPPPEGGGKPTLRVVK